VTVSIVTGGNRGIGLEVCRQLAALGHRVVLGSRRLEAGEEAAAGIDGEVEAVRLDVSDRASIEAAAGWTAERFGRADVVVNNAAILYDTANRGVSVELDVVHEGFEVNLFGAWRMVQSFLPLLRRSDHGRIVNISSEGGSLASMGGGAPTYSVSKAALNALTRVLAAELRPEGILVNSTCPGWVATDVGGPGGRPVAKGAASVVWAVTLPDDGPTGGFFRDGLPVPW
jgi:NAD(P)-dependent dehydrogenase (short-subunit alcohol dehydrogenase family)